MTLNQNWFGSQEALSMLPGAATTNFSHRVHFPDPHGLTVQVSSIDHQA
jgi:hypothetical protein